MTAECFITDPLGQTLGSVWLDALQSRHLNKAVRKNIGEEIEVIDGCGNIGTGLIIAFEQDRVLIDLKGIRRIERNLPEFHLVVALPKSEKTFNSILKGTTQLGVWYIWPVYTMRSRHFTQLQIKQKVRRWDGIIRSSCKQCRQAWFPEIKQPQNLNGFLDCGYLNDSLKFVGWEPKLGNVISFKSLPDDPDPRVFWMVGPEGGWTQDECHLIKNAGFQPIQLGDLILTTEVSCVAGLGVLNTKYNSTCKSSTGP